MRNIKLFEIGVCRPKEGHSFNVNLMGIVLVDDHDSNK